MAAQNLCPLWMTIMISHNNVLTLKRKMNFGHRLPSLKSLVYSKLTNRKQYCRCKWHQPQPSSIELSVVYYNINIKFIVTNYEHSIKTKIVENYLIRVGIVRIVSECEHSGLHSAWLMKTMETQDKTKKSGVRWIKFRLKLRWRHLLIFMNIRFDIKLRYFRCKKQRSCIPFMSLLLLFSGALSFFYFPPKNSTILMR